MIARDSLNNKKPRTIEPVRGLLSEILRRPSALAPAAVVTDDASADVFDVRAAFGTRRACLGSFGRG